MVNTIIIKNDDTSGNTPADNELVTGELAVNTADGKLFYGDNNGDAQEFSMTGIALTDLSVGSEGSASGDGAIAYNNSTGVFTYTPPAVGDGGFTQNNFTNTLKSKLDGIEASATADQSKSDIEGLAIQTVGALSHHLLPSADDTYDLGSSSAAWQDLHIEGNIESTDAMSINSGAGDISFGPAEHLTLGANKRFEFGDSGEYIVGDGTDLSIVSSNDMTFTTADDFNFKLNTDATTSTFNVYGDGGDDIFLRMIPDSHEFQLRYNGSSTNLFKINTAANGATTLSTADSDGTAGHLTLDIDGNITLDADGGTITFSDNGSSLGTITSSGYSGNAGTATTLATARNIGGVSFDGSANINLPGVNTSGNQDTTGNAATATKLAATKTIAGVAFDGSANISLNNNAITNGAGYTTNTGTVDTTGTVNANEFAQFSDSNTLQALTAAEMRSALNVADGATANTGDITGVTAGDGLTGGGTSGAVTLAVGVDDSSIEINSDALRVKASGITNAMLAGSIATSKISSGTFADARIASSNVTQHSGDITSLGTLSALTVDNINVNGNTIKSTNSDGDLIFGGNDGGSSITALTLDMSASGKAIFNDTISVGDEVRMPSDGSAIRFGADEEMVLEHQHNTGLRLSRNDDGGTPTLQFFDAGESVGSDGSKLILTSGGTTFNMPTSDGSNGQVLQTNGSGTLSFASASGGASALNDLSDVTYSSGDLTISSLDKIISGAITHDSSGIIELDGTGGIKMTEAGNSSSTVTLRPTEIGGNNFMMSSGNVTYYRGSSDSVTVSRSSDVNNNVMFLPIGTHASMASADDGEHYLHAPCNGKVLAVILTSNNNLIRDDGNNWFSQIQILEGTGSGANVFGGSVSSGDTRVDGGGGLTEVQGIAYENGEYQEALYSFATNGSFALTAGKKYAFVFRQSHMGGVGGTTNASKAHTINATYIIAWDEVTSGSSLGGWSGY